MTTKALGEVTITATGSETSNCNEARSASYTLKVVETAGIKAIDLATPHSLRENGQWSMVPSTTSKAVALIATALARGSTL